MAQELFCNYPEAESPLRQISLERIWHSKQPGRIREAGHRARWKPIRGRC